MSAMHVVFLIFSLTAFSHIAYSHNITEILSRFPEYSVFNDYLTKTKLAVDINTRVPVTVLVLNNNATTRDIAKLPLNTARDILSVHVLLDYFDKMKITELGTHKATTMYHTSERAGESNGYMNVTDLKNGKFGFWSQEDPAARSTLVKEVYKEGNVYPFDIAVIEISNPIIPQVVIKAAGPKVSDVNITRVLEDHGCREFAGLIVKTGLDKTFPEALKKGLTIFAPSYSGFKDPGLPDLNRLTTDEMLTLLKYHFVGDYMPYGFLTAKEENPISTLATDCDGRDTLTAIITDDEFAMKAGNQKSRFEGLLLDTAPLVIYRLTNVLIPSELLEKSQPPVSDEAQATKPGSSPPGAGVPALAPSAAGDARLSGFVKTLIAVSAMVTLSTLLFH